MAVKTYQFYDKGLAHASYAIISGKEMAVVDPARDPQPYLDYAIANDARITAIFETHPHADFVSCHAELAEKTGATVYVSEMYGALYPHKGLKDNESISLGFTQIKALHTPGHSPDSITFLLIDQNGEAVSAFTGDTLFIGDVGRPDLREKAGALTAAREDLARKMYQSTRNVLMHLPAATEVMPAHGAGSLCGKALSSDLTSTIGREVASNYALQPMSEDRFVEVLLEDQPFVPAYFGHSVELNRKGAPSLKESLASVPRLSEGSYPTANCLVIDVRPETSFKEEHLAGAINLQDGGKFETWLGSVVKPGEQFFLVGDDASKLEEVLYKASKIGYELYCCGLIVNPGGAKIQSAKISAAEILAVPEELTIIDTRNNGEYKERIIFPQALHIPLPELRDRLNEIPQEKTVVVHCAAGYRSAAAQSIIEGAFPELQVLDLSDDIKSF